MGARVFARSGLAMNEPQRAIALNFTDSSNSYFPKTCVVYSHRVRRWPMQQSEQAPHNWLQEWRPYQDVKCYFETALGDSQDAASNQVVRRVRHCSGAPISQRRGQPPRQPVLVVKRPQQQQPRIRNDDLGVKSGLSGFLKTEFERLDIFHHVRGVGGGLLTSCSTPDQLPAFLLSVPQHSVALAPATN